MSNCAFVPVVISEAEARELATVPAALDALIDYHDEQESMADAMDYAESARWHAWRRAELKVAKEQAEAVRRSWEE